MRLKNIKYKIYLLLFLGGSVPLGIRAQVADESTGTQGLYLTVEELFRLGVENSLQVKSAQINEQVAGEHEKTAKAIRLPEIEAGFTGGYLGQPTLYSGGGLKGAMNPEMPDWLQNYQASVTQPLYQGGKIKYNIGKKELEKQNARIASERDIAEIKLLLVGQYLHLLKLYKQRNVLTRNIEEAERQLHDIGQLKKQKMVTENDVIRSELQLTNYKLALLQTNNDIIILSQKLDVVLGLDENILLEPDTALLGRPRPVGSYEQYVLHAYMNYPELKIIQTDKQLAWKELQLAKADNRPSLSLRASNTLERPLTASSPVQDLFMNTWNVSVSLSYRLSSLYHNKHNVRVARLNNELEDVREEQQKQEVRTKVKTACVRYREADDRIQALTVYLRQANENHRIMQNKYRNQLAILTELLDAENIRLDAELQLTAAQADKVYIWYQLQRINGEL